MWKRCWEQSCVVIWLLKIECVLSWMLKKLPGHQNRKEENTITNSHSTTVLGLEAPGRWGCHFNRGETRQQVSCRSLPHNLFCMFREMNKVSDRPGLGAEPVPVSVKLHFAKQYEVCGLLLLVYWTFLHTFLSSREKRKSLSFGITPPTNKRCARLCLHGSRNLSDHTWTHPLLNMWSLHHRDMRRPSCVQCFFWT